MKKLLITLSLVAVVIIGAGIFYYSTQPTSSEITYSEQLKKDVQEYLINEKDYSEGDIQEIKVIENSKLKGKERFEITVVFTDDKDSVYYYDYDKSGKVYQLAVTGTQHEEQ
ncbi:DUF3139 domain-containing protein [[Brevibacterium] frigoritolerans]|nr:DUF3139 domain-containing protein [Peribacillus frigoritolerans]